MALSTIAPVARPDVILRLCDDSLSLERLEARESVERHGDLVMMTSGSTGAPKGVALTLDKVVLNAVAAGSVMEVWRCEAWSIDIDMALMSAVSHMLMAWQFNLPLHHLAELGTQECAAIFATARTGFGGSPIQLVRMKDRLGAGCEPAMLVSSGDFLTPAMIGEVAGDFPDTPIHKLYGLTELGGRFCCLPHDRLMEFPESVGSPLPGFSARACADGVIEASSPLLAAGYYMADGSFTPFTGDWFATGDIGLIEDGLVTLQGRADDVIKVGGEKVDRQSVEGALANLIKPAEFCVLGVEHSILGQCLALFIDDTQGKLPGWGEIVACVRAQLPSRFVPALVYRVPGGIPRLSNGKVDRDRLKRTHAQLPRLT